jgi:hypothetical protein
MRGCAYVVPNHIPAACSVSCPTFCTHRAWGRASWGRMAMHRTRRSAVQHVERAAQLDDSEFDRSSIRSVRSTSTVASTVATTASLASRRAWQRLRAFACLHAQLRACQFTGAH